MKKRLHLLAGFLLGALALQAQTPEVPDMPTDPKETCIDTIASIVQEEETGFEGFFMPLPKAYRFRVTLKDKNHNPYSLKRPGEFLSPKALARRQRLGLKVDRHDLPITPAYVDRLKSFPLQIHNMSKWNNTVVVQMSDTALASQIRQLDFVKEVKLVWERPDSIYLNLKDDFCMLGSYLCETGKSTVSMLPFRKEEILQVEPEKGETPYGQAETQNHMLNLLPLHEAGYRGQGMTIAVIDGGFFNADLITAIDQKKIAGTRNFVRPGFSVFDEHERHGTMVLSCMAAQQPYVMTGTAPEATFWLLQSEDGFSEQLVEEDNWCAAVEYADSLGVDVISTSLGYQLFDQSEMSHKYWEMDGMTAINSRSASLAASRGMLVLNSAGNSGDDAWKKVSFPADAKDILAVGAVTAERMNTPFSSIGNTADGRIKPDVMAMGGLCSVFDSDNTIAYVNGTSFSCPIMAGAVTCLWQAFPHLRPETVIEAVKAAGDNVSHPDNIFGYGIPDIWKAYQSLTKTHKP